MSAVTLELPEDVLARARRVASETHMPLERVLADALARAVVAWEESDLLRTRAERGRHVDIKAILAKAPDVEPDPSDRIE